MFCPTYFKINIAILPTFYAYMAWLLHYNLAFNNGVNVFCHIRIGLGCKLKKENITPWIMIGVHCMNHYTNFKIQNVSKMFARNIENVLQCLHAYYYHYFRPNVQSFFMYIEFNSKSLLKSPKLTIGHLKVGKFKKTLNSLRGQ